MTSITATQYGAYYSAAVTSQTAAKYSTASQTTTNSGTSGGNDSATTIELSDEAKAVLAAKDFTTITSDMRKTLDDLLEKTGLTSPYDEGVLAIDLTEIDRRSLYAAASNSEDKFSEDEQKAAKGELARRFDAALAGPAAVARVTGDLTDVYAAGASYMDAASAEEKGSETWIAQRAALTKAQAAVKTEPGQLPNVTGDPVAGKILQVNTGAENTTRPLSSLAQDVRVALDQQIAAADAAGKSSYKLDFKSFNSRSLASVVLNDGNQFSSSEVSAAKAEMRGRSSATLTACATEAGKSGDPTALAKNIISAFASLSVEERQAAGWSDALYQTALSNYESSAKLAQMFGSGGSSSQSLLSFI